MKTCTFIVMSCWILLRVGDASDKIVNTVKIRISLSISFNCAVYEIMRINVVHSDRPQMAIWRVRIECWITKATDTHSEYVIVLAFPLQQWLHECSSMLHLCMHFLSCLSLCLFDFYGQECYPGTSWDIDSQSDMVCI